MSDDDKDKPQVTPEEDGLFFPPLTELPTDALDKLAASAAAGRAAFDRVQDAKRSIPESTMETVRSVHEALGRSTPSKASGISRAPAPPPTIQARSYSPEPRDPLPLCDGSSMDDIGRAVEHNEPTGARASEEPSTTGHVHSYLARFSFTDLVVLVVNECLGVPLCIAGGENFSHTDWVGSAIGWGVGIPLCVSGVTFPFWRGPVKTAVATWVERRWQLLLPTTVLLAFIYAVGPEMYRRATAPIAVAGAIGVMPIGTASIDEITARATKKIADERDDAIKSAAKMAKERDDAIRQKDVAIAGAKSGTLTSTEAASDSGPIKWDSVLWFPASTAGNISYIMLRGENSSDLPVQMKSASFTSALTGEKRNLSVSIPYGTLDGEKILALDTNPIPAGAKIQLVSEWTPPISVLEFMNRWGKMSLSIDYDGAQYRKTFSEEFMKAALLRDVVGADLVLGVPRVTKKESAK